MSDWRRMLVRALVTVVPPGLIAGAPIGALPMNASAQTPQIVETAATADAPPKDDLVDWSLPAGYEASLGGRGREHPDFRPAPPRDRVRMKNPEGWRLQQDKARLRTIEYQLGGPDYRRRGPRTAEQPRGRRRDPGASLLDIERRTLQSRIRINARRASRP